MRSAMLTAAPRALILHPAAPVLYAANCVTEYHHRPRGSLSAFRIEKETGTLSLLCQEPLTLSSTLPDQVAIAPDGKHIAVATSEAGIVNLFPLDGRGHPGPVTSAVKLAGLGGRLSGIAFDASSGTVLAGYAGWTESLDVMLDSSLVRGTRVATTGEMPNRSRRPDARLTLRLAGRTPASFAILHV